MLSAQLFTPRWRKLRPFILLLRHKTGCQTTWKRIALPLLSISRVRGSHPFHLLAKHIAPELAVLFTKTILVYFYGTG